jgi:NDP-sugar pyrophosphorylase family protein
LLAEEFVLIYGDSYLPIDYGSVLDTLRGTDVMGTVVVYDNGLGDSSVRNNIAVDHTGFVARYDKHGTEDDLRYVEAGVLALRRNITDLIPPGRAVSLEQEIFPQLIEARTLAAYRTTQRFFDIGTPERLKSIEALFANDRHANTVSD